jgi:hypothetical protein
VTLFNHDGRNWWGGALESSAATTTTDSSSACDGGGSVLEGWERGSEDTTHTLNARRFRGARLSTPVSACPREDRKQRQQANQVGRITIKKIRSRRLTSWSAPGLSSPGGLTSPARGLRASTPPTRGLRASGPPSRGPLRFNPPSQRRQRSPPLARGLTPRPSQRPGLDRGPHQQQGTHERPGHRHPG